MSERRSTVAVGDGASRAFVLGQQIRYRYSRPVSNVRQRLKIVPPSAHGPQRRRRWHLTVDGVQSSSTRTFLDPFGNLTVDVNVPQVDDVVLHPVEVPADLPTATKRLRRSQT